MIENKYYKQSIRFIAFILFPAYVVSSVLNILYIANVVEENVMRIGITCVVFISLVMNLINAINVFIHKELKQKIKNVKKFDKIISYLTITFMIVWLASFLICMILK